MDEEYMAIMDAKRIVVKIGTSSLTHNTGKPSFRRIERLAKVLSDLKNSGKEVLLVSSGAIAVGVSRLGLCSRPADIKGKQAAAAVGQCDLMSIYDRAFAEYGYVTAQILLDRSITGDEQRKFNVINTFEELLSMGAVPIVNENDSTSVEEIEFGDNDRLSAIVAHLVSADALIIMTDIDGLYDSDPKTCPGAKLIHTVEEITGQMYENAGGAGSSRGTGGMHTKLEAAEIAMLAGIDVAIVRGDDAEILYDLMEGKPAGTYFPAKKLDSVD